MINMIIDKVTLGYTEVVNYGNGTKALRLTLDDDEGIAFTLDIWLDEGSDVSPEYIGKLIRPKGEV